MLDHGQSKRAKFAAPVSSSTLGRIPLTFLDRAVRRLKTNFSMRAIAEGPVRARPTATERKGDLARQVVFIAVNIDNFHDTIGIVDP